MQIARDFSRSGGVIDDDGTLVRAGEDAILPQHHLAQIVVITDAGHDEVLARSGVLRRRRAFAAMLRDPLLGLGAGAVEHRDIMAALGLQMPCHGVAHHA